MAFDKTPTRSPFSIVRIFNISVRTLIFTNQFQQNSIGRIHDDQYKRKHDLKGGYTPNKILQNKFLQTNCIENITKNDSNKQNKNEFHSKIQSWLQSTKLLHTISVKKERRSWKGVYGVKSSLLFFRMKLRDENGMLTQSHEIKCYNFHLISLPPPPIYTPSPPPSKI